MNEQLVLIVGATPADPVIWGGLSGDVLNELGRLDSLAALATISDRFSEELTLAVVLQGESAAMRSLPNPPKNLSKLKSASVLLLEDELAEDADDLHIAIATSNEIGKAYAINRAYFQNWIEILRDHGVEPDFLTVDFACLDATPEAPLIIQSSGSNYCEHGRAWIRR